MKNTKRFLQKRKFYPLSLIALTQLFLCTAALADDTEIYFSSNANTTNRANILLLLDTSGSMGRTDPNQTASRLALMQNALNSIIDGATNINIGLARFTSPGGAIVYPVTNVDENVCTTIENCIPANQTILARQKLKQTVNNFTAASNTPLVTSMLEAASYFRSEPVFYGTSRGANRKELKRVSHPATYTGGNLTPSNRSCTDSNSTSCRNENISGSPIYNSPISTNCQSNHLVVLSDGVANSGDKTRILNLINSNNGADPDVVCDTNVPNTGGQCGKELAAFLKNYDQSNLFTDSKITTHTIGFAGAITNNPSATTYMQEIANAGGGIFRPANSSADLVAVFNEIINTAKDTNSSFSNPSIRVNQANRISNSDDIYMALFKPSSRQNWAGNLKRYSLKPNSAGKLTVYDANGQAAIDPVTQGFYVTAKSFWSTQTDGNVTSLGGAAEKLIASRTVYSNLSTASNLSNPTNAFTATNITALDLGAANNTERDAILNWATGTDNGTVIDTGAYAESLIAGRQQMGAPLHSEPVIVSYDDTLTIPDTTLYFGTNEGYLHAIDTQNGNELFSFIPKSLLKNLKVLKDNATNTTSNLVYGVDGPVTVWQYDADKNKKITGTNSSPALTDDHVILYAGLRRGGQNYFALDVTSRNSPKVLWSIDNTTPGFTNLGQTWSRPILANIDLSTLNVGGATGITKVLIFAGGYDTTQDTKTVRSADTVGTSIYIVNPLTGALIWSGGPNATFSTSFVDMKYSIPSDISVVDVNLDDVIDLMYVGDMGGQIWRFDFDSAAAGSSNNVTDLITGGVIADINDGTIAGNRRFYNVPDIALINGPSGRYLTIAIGSGWRAHPLDTTITNRFYVINDSNYRFIQTTYTKATETNLYDATLNAIQEGADQLTRDAATTSLQNAEGWYVTMENSGEKILSTALTFENSIVFTTYQPETTPNTTACTVSVGTGRYYFMSIVNATPIVQVTNTRTDRVYLLPPGSSGIPQEPGVFFPDDGKGTGDVKILVGSNELPFSIDRIFKTHWRVKD